MAPTILEYAGLDRSPQTQGQSLKPLVDGKKIEDWRESFFYEHWFNANGRIAPSEGVRTMRWKYIRYFSPGNEEQGVSRQEELYDLSVDPHETTNLSGNSQHSKQLDALRRDWSKFRVELR